MRTTVRLDDDLFRRVRRFAAETCRTLTEVMEDALGEMLGRHSGKLREDVSLPTFDGGRVLPAVDLDDNAALRDLMDASETTDRYPPKTP